MDEYEMWIVGLDGRVLSRGPIEMTELSADLIGTKFNEPIGDDTWPEDFVAMVGKPHVMERLISATRPSPR